jgi:ribulose-5-phosphate 4-epimerase/fuculose-1-phosphate aldolase
LMIKGHGAVVIGEDVEEACMNMVRMERTAKMMMYAAALGEPVGVPPSVGKRFAEIYPRKGGKQQPAYLNSVGHRTEFQYYEWLLKNGATWPKL